MILYCSANKKSSTIAHSIRVQSLYLHFPKFPTKSQLLLFTSISCWKFRKIPKQNNSHRLKIVGHFLYCIFCCCCWRALEDSSHQWRTMDFRHFMYIFISRKSIVVVKFSLSKQKQKRVCRSGTMLLSCRRFL